MPNGCSRNSRLTSNGALDIPNERRDELEGGGDPGAGDDDDDPPSELGPQLAFQRSGVAFHPISEEVVAAAYNRRKGRRNGLAKFEWPALLRKLDRIDPSYRE
jgi:hypothetical protein